MPSEADHDAVHKKRVWVSEWVVRSSQELPKTAINSLRKLWKFSGIICTILYICSSMPWPFELTCLIIIYCTFKITNNCIFCTVGRVEQAKQNQPNY